MTDFAEKMADSSWDHPEFWRARGIGSNSGWKSLVTGEVVEFGPDVSGFVSSKDAGERLVEALDGRAYLDYRPSEPNWIQLKLIVEEEHRGVLQRLVEANMIYEGMIRPRTIAWAIDPERYPGYEPIVLRLQRESGKS